MGGVGKNMGEIHILPELERPKRRLVLVTYFIFGVASFVYGLLYLVTENYNQAMFSGLAFLLNFGAPLILRKTRNVALAGNYTLGVATFLLLGIVMVSGGLRSDTMHWLIIIPFYSLFISSHRAGLLWFFGICVLTLALFYAEIHNTFSLSTVPSLTDSVMRATAFLLFYSVIYVLAYRFYDAIRFTLQRVSVSRKEAEHEREKAEKANRAKSEFLASMSHELRTPLNAILGFAQLMQHEKEIPPQYRSYLETMYNSGRHLLVMINEVLDLSKIEAGKMEAVLEQVNIHALLADITSMFKNSAQEKGLNFESKCDESVPKFIVGDGGKIRQILINLLGNAIKFTESGVIRLHTRVGIVDATSYNYLSDKESLDEHKLIFSVSDTGEGIEQSDISVIFEPFKQIGNDKTIRGTGLGLSLVTNIARLLNGGIAVRSTLGKGSSFDVFLTLESPSSLESSSSNIPSRISYVETKEPIRIMVVDDISYNIELTEKILGRLGFVTFGFSSATEALNAVPKIRPHVILMDLRMPNMSGFEFLEQIRSHADKTVASRIVIAFSASVFDETEEMLKARGFDGFLMKPFIIQDLVEKIGEFFPLKIKYEVVDSEEATISPREQFVAVYRELPEEERTAIFDALETSDVAELHELLVELSTKHSALKPFLSYSEGSEISFWLDVLEMID